MSTVDWEGRGLRWINPEAAVAHPLDDGQAAVVWRNLDRTASDLGPDAEAYRGLFGPARQSFEELVSLTMNPPTRLASAAWQHPGLVARLAPTLLAPATATARRFETGHGRAIVAGHAAHSIAPLNKPLTSGFALVLGASAHAVGWPFPAGGASEITRVLAEELVALQGEIRVEHPVRSLADLPATRAAIFALTPRQLANIVGDRFSRPTRLRLRRYRYGPGVCKVDFATSDPVPWANPDVAAAPTVHVGGSFDEILEAEAEVAAGRHARNPFVLLAQHSLFDPSRAPDGHHTVWAYCHVPNGSSIDMSGAIKAQIERFAPGFRDTVVAECTTLPADLERDNANLVGGDIAGGSNTGIRALFRPGFTLSPHRTEVPSFFVGSASTPPGAGVHGMGGFHAAEQALEYLQ